VLNAQKLVEMQRFNLKIYSDIKIKEYVSELVDATRHPERYGLDLYGYIEYGASPRASLWLIIAAKAHAMMNGRGYVKPEDVKAIAHDVLRHRVLLTYEAEAEGVSPDQVITKILENVKVP